MVFYSRYAVFLAATSMLTYTLSMRNIALYIVTVLIWGSTWLAIEFQIGEVAVEVSLVYRFAIAAILMWAYCWWAKTPMMFTGRNHLFICMLASFNFSINYLVVYWSQLYLTSAMTSIAFSTMLMMNIINTRIFFGTVIAPRVYLGALIGIAGIVALFWNDIGDLSQSNNITLGLFLAFGGAAIASIGNMISIRNSKRGLNLFAANAWGMLYGTLILSVVALISGAEFTISSKPSYLISLFYLGTFGTVIAFATFFILLRDMGPEKASYSIVLFPVVALILSSIFEDFIWTPNIILGFGLILLGNAIVLTPAKKLVGLMRGSEAHTTKKQVN